jgi:hypothetical protein
MSILDLTLRSREQKKKWDITLHTVSAVSFVRAEQTPITWGGRKR